MNEMEIHESVFPFVCQDRECRHEFDINDFADVILLWGYIHMANQGNTLIGITCPHCIKTTIRKYTSPNEVLYALSNILGDNLNYVPFSYKILKDYSLVEDQDIEESVPW